MSNPENGRAAEVLYGLIERGGSDIDARSDALRLALRNLIEDCMAAHPQSMIDPVDFRTLHRMATALSDACFVSTFLLDQLSEHGDGEMKMTLTRRRSGPLTKWQERARDHKFALAAARWVERLERSGMPTDAAVSLVVERSGLTRSQVYWGRKARKMGLEFKVFDRWWD